MHQNRFVPVPDFAIDSLTPAQLVELAGILERHQVSLLKFTASGRLRLAGLDPERMSAIAAALQPYAAPPSSHWFTTLHSCPGGEWCRHGLANSEQIAGMISTIELPCPPPAKIKIAIAGCSRCCTEPLMRDAGLIAEAGGWKLVFGGNAGGRPRIGDVIATGLGDNQAIALLRDCLMVYMQHATGRMRTARFMEKVGIAWFLDRIASAAGKR